MRTLRKRAYPGQSLTFGEECNRPSPKFADNSSLIISRKGETLMNSKSKSSETRRRAQLYSATAMVILIIAGGPASVARAAGSVCRTGDPGSTMASCVALIETLKDSQRSLEARHASGLFNIPSDRFFAMRIELRQRIADAYRTMGQIRRNKYAPSKQPIAGTSYVWPTPYGSAIQGGYFALGQLGGTTPDFGDIYEVDGKITVPDVIVPTKSGACPNTQILYAVSHWVGIGGLSDLVPNGDFDDNLFQAGVIEQWPCSTNGPPQIAAFWEDYTVTGYPNGTSPGSNGLPFIYAYPVSQGDVIEVTVSVTEMPAEMHWTLKDDGPSNKWTAPTGEYTDQNDFAPEWTAEAIVERQRDGVPCCNPMPKPSPTGSATPFTTLHYSAAIDILDAEDQDLFTDLAFQKTLYDSKDQGRLLRPTS